MSVVMLMGVSAQEKVVVMVEQMSLSSGMIQCFSFSHGFVNSFGGNSEALMSHSLRKQIFAFSHFVTLM